MGCYLCMGRNGRICECLDCLCCLCYCREGPNNYHEEFELWTQLNEIGRIRDLYRNY